MNLNTKEVEGLGGWLMFYIIFSIPVLLFYSAGLSGWFFEYPLILLFAIFTISITPIVLILMKSSKAIYWNIFMSRVMTALLLLRIFYGLIVYRIIGQQPPMNSIELVKALPMLVSIIVLALGWASLWIKYFQTSKRIKNTFGYS